MPSEGFETVREYHNNVGKQTDEPIQASCAAAHSEHGRRFQYSVDGPEKRAKDMFQYNITRNRSKNCQKNAKLAVLYTKVVPKAKTIFKIIQT